MIFYKKFDRFNYQEFSNFIYDLVDHHGFWGIRFKTYGTDGLFSENQLTHATYDRDINDERGFIGAWSRKTSIKKISFSFFTLDEVSHFDMTIDLNKKVISLDQSVNVSDNLILDTLKKNLTLTGDRTRISKSKKTDEDLLKLFKSLRLHPRIEKMSQKLFKEKNYRHAILDVYIDLVATVKEKAGDSSNGLDNSPLMETVFSQNKPIIKVSDDKDEQLGFQWLFKGAVMGIRNPKAHKVIPQKDPYRTLSWLSFASALLYILDESSITDTQS